MTETSIYQRIAEHAKIHPDAIAILAEDHSATYHEVMECADAVCRKLKSAGLRDEDPVAVFMTRRADLVGILLGIWKAGGAYVPIDPGEQVERAKRMIAISRCTYVLGDRVLCERVLNDDEAATLQFIDAANIKAGSCEGTTEPDRSQAMNLAYLFFTSGSTGEPKAVEVEHQSVTNLLQASGDLLSITQADRYLAATTISFDISVVELFLPLTVGGSIVFRDKAILLDPAGLAKLIADSGITVLQTGPSVWSLLLNAVPDFPHLRVAISTGEAISPQIADRIANISDHAWNLYGPTETTVWVTGYEITQKSDNSSGSSAPIGVPFLGIKTRIVDDDLKKVPDGQRGELLVGGVCVARGYRNQNTLTREKFIRIGTERFYRTGDVVACNALGNIEYFGRVDEQMIIRGLRVEPGEIEEAIRSDPRVKEVAVTWFQTRSDSRSMVAAIVLETDENCTSEDFYNTLKGKIPSALIPAKFIFVPWLPINKNGKVDRSSIRSAAGNTQPVAQETDRPSGNPQVTPTQATIAHVWKRMLGLEEVSPNAHFFAIGGDSLAAVTMTHEIEALLDVSLPAQLALETPTLGKFAERVEEIRSGHSSSTKAKFIFPMFEEAGSRPVFFCGGNLTLVRHWKIPCSLYFVAYWAEGGDFVEGDTIEEVAANCLNAMREFQPAGPYRIAGYSFGGVLAFEIAQQFIRLGEGVEFLFLLDPYKPYIEVESRRDVSPTELHSFAGDSSGFVLRKGKNALGSLKSIRKHGGFKDWFFLQIGKMPGGIKLAYWMSHLQNRHPNPVSKALVARWKWPVYWFEAKKKLARYRPGNYSGKATVIFSETQDGQDMWSSLLAEETRIQTVKLEHHQMFQHPENEQWLPILGEQIGEADQRGRS